MRLWALTVVMVCVGLVGCSLRMNGSGSGDGRGHSDSIPDDGDDGDGTSASRRPNLSCAPPEPGWTEVETLYSVTEDSVHELITCGGLQIRLTQQLMMMVIGSNTDLLKPEERAVADAFISNPFDQNPDGSWSMEVAGSPGSSFALSFYDPRNGELIRDDIFDLESYLAGVDAQSTMTFTEMLADRDRKNVFRFEWEADGPLAGLMNDGEPLPEGGFELELSLNDFLGGTPLGAWVGQKPADYGPFSSIMQIEVDSLVDYVDARDSADVEYKVRTQRDAVAHIAATASLAFQVEQLQTVTPELVLEGDASELRFVERGRLAGTIDYDIAGDLVHVKVTSDFGEGQAYPMAKWSCP